MQSSTLSMKCAVSQGSILGPFVFICAINDINIISNFIYAIVYADDTSVWFNKVVYIIPEQTR